MALLHFTMLPLGSPLPQFSLADTVTGSTFTSTALFGSPSLLMVICNHCPYVVRIKGLLSTLGRQLQERGVRVVAISSNDPVSHPADGPEKMKLDAEKSGYSFPYLFDPSQDLARALQAVCTPEFYLFDADCRLTYRGRLDESTPANGRVSDGADLLGAVEGLLSGLPPIEAQHPSMGCSIKWA